MNKTLRIQKNKAFVLLFTIIISSIILAVAFGVANIALKEVNFATSARDTNEAFYAADVGAECALYNDISTASSFLQTGSSGSVSCLGNTISTSNTSASSWRFVLGGLGDRAQNCAIVDVTKDFAAIPVTTIIDSKGYNLGAASCVSTANNLVERYIQVNY